MTELQKKIKEKESEIDVLKDMVVSGKRETKSRDITISKLKKRIGQLEKITGIRGQRNMQSDIQSMQSYQNSQRGAGKIKFEDPQDLSYDEGIEEAEEGLEETGRVGQNAQGNYEMQNQGFQPYPSKTPNVKAIKGQSGKAAMVDHYGSYNNQTMPRGPPSVNPFNDKLSRGYDDYLDHLEHGDFKNSSNQVKNIFNHSQSKSNVLPQI